jgi:hypothetical protein
MSSEPAIYVPEQRAPRRELAAPITGGANAALIQVLANAARDPDVDVSKMQALFEMHERVIAREAKQAYTAAMAKFKENPPKIVKDAHVKFQTSKGITEYDHATLAGVVNAIIEGLAKVEISHAWETEQLEGGMIRVTCTLTHSSGHATRTPLEAGRDDSGGKNNIQALGSTVTYLQRYTLLAATGLAAGIADNDGRGGKEEPLVSEDQVANLLALITEVNADRARFLDFFKAVEVADIPAAKYQQAVQMLEAKRRLK